MSLPRKDGANVAMALASSIRCPSLLRPLSPPPAAGMCPILDRRPRAQYDSPALFLARSSEGAANPGRLVVHASGRTILDVLSDVLRAVRLTGAIYFDVHACHPWVAETPPISSIGANVMPEFEYVIPFHIMLDGWCWAQLAGESEPAMRVDSGDAVLFIR